MSERLADDIVEIIRSERLGPGDVLASSRELARRFDVTTPTVREALRRLEATGVVEFRHGSGTYVGPGIDRGCWPTRTCPAAPGSRCSNWSRPAWSSSR
ncbi:winged helix-turn-helix domain-containing protein [Streptosporangium lutulentum]